MASLLIIALGLGAAVLNQNSPRLFRSASFDIAPKVVAPGAKAVPGVAASTIVGKTPTVKVTTGTKSVPTTGGAAGGNVGLSVAEQLNGLTDSQFNTAMDDIKSLGVSWLRTDFSWNSIEGQGPGTFDWSRQDRLVSAAHARGIKVLGIIDETPGWARASGCHAAACAPADPAQFATFAGQVVARYNSQGVTNWEIWNEPNSAAAWQPSPNAGAYVTLLHLAYNAIKSLNPEAEVVSGGLAPEPNDGANIAQLDFAAAMYSAGAEPYFDAFGYHPYSFPVLASDYQSWNAWSQMAQTPVSLRSIMTAHGDSNKKIWATEFGAPTGGPGALATASNLNLSNSPDHVSEDFQAQFVSDAINQLRQTSWMGPLFWYGYKDLGTNSSTSENFYGLRRADGSPKPSFEAFKQAVASL